MKFAGPLPDQLRQRYVDWKAQGFVDKAKRFEVLAAEGQAPEAMVISCCDSRVSATELFQANPGDFFTHRNIANLVPPFDPDGPHFGTFSAIEYAVTALKVPHIIVIGHSSCGGVRACYNMCLNGKTASSADGSMFCARSTHGCRMRLNPTACGRWSSKAWSFRSKTS